MIEVKLADRHEYAVARYNRYKDSDVIEMTIQSDGMEIKRNISVPEAEKLAKDLLDWVHEIKD